MKIVSLFFLFVMSADGQLYEGDFCNKDGATGVCTSISQCPSALDDIKLGRFPQTCSFGPNEPIVCCVQAPTTTKPVLTTTKRSQSSTTEYIPPVPDYKDVDGINRNTEDCEPISLQLTSRKTGRKAWDRCIDYQEQLVYPCGKSNALGGGMDRTAHCHHNADELIIGGEDAGLYEFPHMTLLGYGSDADSAKWQCGGSLISENFVLTAGHCIADKERENVTYVLVGALKRSDVTDRSKRYVIKNVIPHPQYKSPNKYHDIALLELERPVPLDEYTVPACLHTGDLVDDSRASATGWGLIQHNTDSTSDILQKVVLTKFDTLECAYFFPPGKRHMKNGFDADSMICYGDRTKPKDTCQGDSGGPIQIKSKKISCMYTVVGVTSLGKGCGVAGEPAIYTKVAQYLDWIENIVWPG